MRNWTSWSSENHSQTWERINLPTNSAKQQNSRVLTTIADTSRNRLINATGKRRQARAKPPWALTLFSDAIRVEKHFSHLSTGDGCHSLRSKAKKANVYLDDFVAFSKMETRHTVHVDMVLILLLGAGITLKLKRCAFSNGFYQLRACYPTCAPGGRRIYHKGHSETMGPNNANRSVLNPGSLSYPLPLCAEMFKYRGTSQTMVTKGRTELLDLDKIMRRLMRTNSSGY